jgi:hypothetical protein
MSRKNFLTKVLDCVLSIDRMNNLYQKGEIMAHRGICPDMACERIEIEKQRQPSEREACKVVAKELGVPVATVRWWAQRNGVDGNPSTEISDFEKFYKSLTRMTKKAQKLRGNEDFEHWKDKLVTQSNLILTILTEKKEGVKWV